MKFLGIFLSFLFVGCVSCTHDPKPEPTPLPTPSPSPIPDLPPAEITEKVVVHFDFSSSSLKKSEQQVLTKAFEGKADFPVRIVGHTDSQGSDSYNQKLSEKRADVVVKYLQEKLKVKGKVSFEGKGEKALLNADKTKKEHAENRRAEVVIILN